MTSPGSEQQPSHPTLTAALLMFGIVLVLVLIAVVDVMG